MSGTLTVFCPECGGPVDVMWSNPTVTRAQTVRGGHLEVTLVLDTPKHDCPDPSQDGA